MIVDIPQYTGIGVYKITHTITGRVYIGSSWNCNARLKQHNRCPQNVKMEADAKLGVFTAEILKKFPDGCTNGELADAEREFCDLYEATTDKGYNSPYHSSCMHCERRGSKDGFVFPVYLSKGDKELIKAHAKERKESINAFINRAIDETMERDNKEVQ